MVKPSNLPARFGLQEKLVFSVCAELTRFGQCQLTNQNARTWSRDTSTWHGYDWFSYCRVCHIAEYSHIHSSSTSGGDLSICPITRCLKRSFIFRHALGKSPSAAVLYTAIWLCNMRLRFNHLTLSVNMKTFWSYISMSSSVQ